MSVRDYEPPTMCGGCGEVIRDPEGAAVCKDCGALLHHDDQCQSNHDDVCDERDRPSR